MKVLLVIDMQNDFIDGSLANPAVKAITGKIANFIKNYEGSVLMTKDTHYEDYLDSYEGKNLPVPHCIEGTPGWEIEKTILDAFNSSHPEGLIIEKPYFGHAMGIADGMVELLRKKHEEANAEEFETIKQIDVVGTVTEICVVSNVLGLKALFPNADFVVHSDMCAGLSKEGHNAALTVMKACQVKIV